MIVRASIMTTVLLVALAGCDRRDESPEGDTPTTAASAPSPGAAQASGTPTTDKPSGPAAQRPPVPAVTVSNEGKSVKVNVPDGGGTTVDLQNERGKGSVTTTPSGTTIKGKSGKSITLPGVPQ
jgi:hypothetical protein